MLYVALADYRLLKRRNTVSSMNREYVSTTSSVAGHWALNDDQNHAIVNGNLACLVGSH